MEKYIKMIETLAAQWTKDESDGYAQIMRLCDAMMSEYGDAIKNIDLSAIEQISVKDDLPEADSFSRDYLVIANYHSGKKVFAMTYGPKGRKKVPTWCWRGNASLWEVIFWAEMPKEQNFLTGTSGCCKIKEIKADKMVYHQ